MHRSGGTCALIGLFLVYCPVASAVTWPGAGAKVEDLGVLPGSPAGSYSARAASADGSVVAGNFSGVGSNIPYYWTEATGMVPLDSSIRASAFGISADGSAIVGETYPGGTEYHAFRWTQQTGVQYLGDLPKTGTVNQTFGRAANAGGSLVVGMSNGKPFQWTAAGGVQRLGSVSVGIGRGVSRDGKVVVGGASFTPGTSEAAYWDLVSGGEWNLGDLPGGSVQAIANGVNADGRVVVGVGRDGNNHDQGFRWTAMHGMEGLGHLTDNGSGEAFSVTDDGSLIVGTDSGKAFIWDEQNGIRSLAEVLTNDFGVNVAGWSLSTAYGISGDGRVIVGYGSSPQAANTAWRVVIPEPGSFALGSCGLVMLSIRRRRRCDISVPPDVGS